MILVFYLLPLCSFGSALSRSRRGQYLRFREELTKPPSEWEPMVTIIAHARALMKECWRTLTLCLVRTCPSEVVFVIDDPDDPAAGVIEPAWQEAERHVKLVVAPKATSSSQKVENLREGVLHADPKSEVFVFVDSDARPSPGWLRALIAPLRDETIGAATGYRWFISEEPTLASELRSTWNASIASALGPNEKSNFTWGGSMAIRRDVFDRIGMREKWQGTLSDDFAVTRAMHAAGLRIRFVPQALTASVESCTFRELFEFTNRQMKITRVYMPQLWLMSFFGSGLFNLVMAAAILIAILSKANGVPVWVALATLFLVSFFSVGKAVLRLYAVRLALPQFRPELRRQRFSQYTLWLFTRRSSLQIASPLCFRGRSFGGNPLPACLARADRDHDRSSTITTFLARFAPNGGIFLLELIALTRNDCNETCHAHFSLLFCTGALRGSGGLCTEQTGRIRTGSAHAADGQGTDNNHSRYYRVGAQELEDGQTRLVHPRPRQGRRHSPADLARPKKNRDSLVAGDIIRGVRLLGSCPRSRSITNLSSRSRSAAATAKQSGTTRSPATIRTHSTSFRTIGGSTT